MRTKLGLKDILVSITLFILPLSLYSETFENSYNVNQQISIGNSAVYYVPISGLPSNAIITNVETKFDYIAYGVVQNYVSCRFNKNSDPGSSGGIVIVNQGSLLSGNPGTYGYYSYSNWNGLSANSNYYFRFSLASGSPYTCTINKIYVRVTYTSVLPDLAITNTYMQSISNPGQEYTNPKVGDQVQFCCNFYQ